MGSSCRSRCLPCCRSSYSDSVDDSFNTNLRHPRLHCPNCGKDFTQIYNHRDFPNHIIRCKDRSNFKAKPGKSAPYESKSLWIKEYLNKIRIPWTQESIKIMINREELIESSMNNFEFITQEDFRKEFQVTFIGEIAMDAGGLLREWLTLLMKQFFTEDFGLFDRSKSAVLSYFFKVTENDRTKECRLLGKAVGKALFEKTPIYCPLNRVFFKYLAQEKIFIEDLAYYDEGLYKSLVFIRDNDITGLLFETFQLPDFGQSGNRIELRPGGKDEMVTEENKQEYLKLIIEYLFKTSISAQLKAFLEGFYYVIPKDCVKVLTSEELELIICGLPYIDLQEWQDFTEYRGELSKDHEVVLMFWQILNSLTQDQLSLLILFVTGTPRLPVEGFASLKTTRGEPARFTIEPSPYTKGALPRAHTCFNRLDLPLYTNLEEMKSCLLNVLENHTFGFGIE